MRGLLTIALLSALPVFAEPRPSPTPTPVPSPKPPLATAFVDVTCRWQKGRLTIERVERGSFPTPTVTKRFLGRFEARVRGQGKPLDATRFDFPLLADADSGVRGDLDAELKANLSTTTRIRVPLPDGADEVLIVDLHGGAAVPVPLTTPIANRSATAPSTATRDGGVR